MPIWTADFLCLLALQAPDLATLWQLDSSEPGTGFGSAVAILGDVDGDGTDDVAIGAPRAAALGFATGRVTVASGRTGDVLYAVDGGSAFEAFGSSLAPLGDVDADGVLDLAVGAPGGSTGGAVHALSGATGALLWTRAGEAPGDRFGHALAPLSRPGATDDLLCGAPNADVAGQSAGRAYRLRGSDGTSVWTVDGVAFDLTGTSVSALGASRALVGVPFADDLAFNAGRVRVVSAADGAALFDAFGQTVGDQLGQWLADVGDVDGDGRTDFAVGIPGADANGFDSGAVEIRSGVDASVVWSTPGSAAGLYSGSVGPAGDIDGDGHADLVFGEPSAGRNGDQRGLVRIHSGQDGSRLFAALGQDPNDWFGAALAGRSDLNADGRPDVVVGAPGHEDDPNEIGYVRALASLEVAHRSR